MKKAVIKTGAKQYLVAEGDELAVELIKGDSTKVDFTPLLVINDDEIKVGQPEVQGSKVVAEITKPVERQAKVISIRFKAKKRVNKKRGHRQQKTVIKISSITA